MKVKKKEQNAKNALRGKWLPVESIFKVKHRAEKQTEE
jgi:hypothetical protein